MLVKYIIDLECVGKRMYMENQEGWKEINACQVSIGFWTKA